MAPRPGPKAGSVGRVRRLAAATGIFPGWRPVQAAAAWLRSRRREGLTKMEKNSRMKRANRLTCLGLAAAVLSPMLMATPAAAGCGDGPAAGVDWSKCEKWRLVLRGRDLSNGTFLRTDFSRSDLADARPRGADPDRKSAREGKE